MTVISMTVNDVSGTGDLPILLLEKTDLEHEDSTIRSLGIFPKAGRLPCDFF